MNQMKSKVIVGLVLTLASVMALGQGEKPGLRKEMEAFYGKMDAIIVKGTVKEFFTLFDPSYYLVDTEGQRMSLAQFKQMVNGMAQGAKMVSYVSRIKNVQLQDQEAVVWIQNEMVWKEKSGNGWATKKSTTRWAENLIRKGNSWRFKSSQQLMTNEPWSFKTNG